MLAVDPMLSTDTVIVIGGLFGLAGIAKVVTDILVNARKLREGPAPSPLLIKGVDELATLRVVDQKIAAVDAAAAERARLNTGRITALEGRLEKQHEANSKRLDDIDAKLDRNLKAYSESQTKELLGMHARLDRVAESTAQLVGEMKHVATHAEKASTAAIMAAEAARGAIQAASAERGGKHFSQQG